MVVGGKVNCAGEFFCFLAGLDTLAWDGVVAQGKQAREVFLG